MGALGGFVSRCARGFKVTSHRESHLSNVFRSRTGREEFAGIS